MNIDCNKLRFIFRSGEAQDSAVQIIEQMSTSPDMTAHLQREHVRVHLLDVMLTCLTRGESTEVSNDSCLGIIYNVGVDFPETIVKHYRKSENLLMKFFDEKLEKILKLFQMSDCTRVYLSTWTTTMSTVLCNY